MADDTGYGTDFWGRAKTSNWWGQNMSDAGQGLYADPNMALQVATLPQQVIAAKEKSEQDARTARSGFMSQLMGALTTGAKDIDGVLSHGPGYGVGKSATAEVSKA